ncbi:MAG: hypothetical protein AB7O57_12510 [Hyphomicrobiaceae bacterium]
MSVDPMLWLAVAAFAWGLSLASYRWFATHNGWPMGEWQAHRPGLPIAIGLFSMLLGLLFALARGGPAALWVPAMGLVGAIVWTALLRVGAQVALLLAPLSVIGLLALWMLAASHVAMPYSASTYERDGSAPLAGPASTARDPEISERDRGITRTEPRATPLPR